MSAGTRLGKSSEEVATQIFEDLHRGLARAIETRRAVEDNNGNILFPYNKNTRDTLLYLAAQKFSLPITYSWGPEGPYFMPLRNKIGPNDFTRIANETYTHYPLTSEKWNIRTHRNSRALCWKAGSSQSEGIARPDRSTTSARSQETPSIRTLESFFSKWIGELESRRSGESFVETQCLERDFRRRALKTEFPTETQEIYESAFLLSNVFEMAKERIKPNHSSTLADFGDIGVTPIGENKELYELFEGVQQHTKTVFYHSIRAGFFQSSFIDEEYSEGEESTKDDSIGDLVENIDTFFKISRSSFRYIVESERSHKSKREVSKALDQFYKQRLWPLLSHSIGMTEAQGPQVDAIKEKAREQRDDCYYSFSNDLTNLAKTIKKEIS